MQTAQSGIGLGKQSEAQDRADFVNSRSTMGRIALPFQEMRAARQGRKSEFEQMQEEKAKGRQRQLEEIKAFSEITNKTFENMDKFTGGERAKYIELQSKVLDSFSPGSGALLRSLADDEGYGKLVLKNAEKSPTLRAALEMGGLRKARELMTSVEGAKLIRGEIEGAELPAIRTRLQTLGMAAQELMSLERYKQMQDDGLISPNEVAELNDAAKTHPKYKAAVLSDEQLALAARNEDATYGMAGFATSKTAQESLKERGKNKAESDLGKLKSDLKAGRITQAEYNAKYKKLTHVTSGDEPSQKDIVTVELKLSDDYRADTKKFAERRPMFDSATDYMANRTEKKTSAGDAALMFAYAKMRDPNDRLAVSETRDLVKLGNIFERIGVSVTGVLEKGETLPDRVATDMYAEIRRAFTEQNRQQAKVEADYRNKTTAYKGNADRVVRPYAIPEEQLNPKGGGDEPSQSDLEFTAKKHGITVEEVKRRLKAGKK